MRLRVAGLLATLLLPLSACSESSNDYLPDASEASKSGLAQYVESGQMDGLTSTGAWKDVDLASLPRQPAVDSEFDEQALTASIAKSTLRSDLDELHGFADDDFSATKTVGLRYLQTSGKNAQD